MVFAVSGSLAAGRKQMDFFGVIVLALVTALGGGTLRDVLLNSGPVFWVSDHYYLYVVVSVPPVVFLLVKRYAISENVLLLLDAFGLAVFTVVGTVKAFNVTGSIIIAVIMGVMTGVAGGIIRDLLSKEVPLILRKEIYASAALAGSLVCVLLEWFNFPEILYIVLSISVTFSIRMAAIHMNTSLPVFSYGEESVKIASSTESRKD
jgi:uncharacterized membrane protein YeiH